MKNIYRKIREKLIQINRDLFRRRYNHPEPVWSPNAVLRTDLVTYKSVRGQIDIVSQKIPKPDFSARNFDKINLYEYNLDKLTEEAKQKIVDIIHEDNINREDIILQHIHERLSS